MNPLNPCNRCWLDDIQRLADAGNGHVVIKTSRTGDPVLGVPDAAGGYDIFIKYPDKPEPVKAIWVAGLAPECACKMPFKLADETQIATCENLPDRVEFLLSKDWNCGKCQYCLRRARAKMAAAIGSVTVDDLIPMKVR